MKYLSLLIGLIITLPIYADELGRLFYTPQQRIQLEQQATSNQIPQDNTNIFEHDEIKLNGIVQKNGGQRTIWINGIAQETTPAQSHAPTSTHIDSPSGRNGIKLKVGERIPLHNTPEE